MKKIFLLALSSLFLFACSGDSTDLKNYIPASAKTVVMINNKAIVDEIKWDILFGKGKLEFKIIDDALVRLLAENPVEAGINLSAKSFVFTTDSAVCAMLPLNSGDDLQALLTANTIEVTNGADFAFVKSASSFAVIEDHTLFILWGSFNEKSSAAFIANLKDDKTEKLVNAKIRALDAISSESHVAVFGEENTIASSLGTAADDFVTAPAVKNKASEFVAEFNFKAGKLEGKTKQYYEEGSIALKAFQKPSKIADMMAGVNVDNSILSAGVSIDLMSFLMAQENEGTKHVIDSLMMLYTGMPSEMVASFIEGDFYASLNKVDVSVAEKVIKTREEQNDEENIDFLEGPVLKFDYNAAFTLKDTILGRMGLVRQMMEFAPSVKNSVYYFAGAKTYMFFKGYNVYFTSDEAAIAKILSAKAGDKNTSLATFSNGIYLNFTDLSKKLPVQVFPQMMPVIQLFEKNIRSLKYSTLPVKGKVLEGDFVIEGANKNENILVSLLRLLNEFKGYAAPQS